MAIKVKDAVAAFSEIGSTRNLPDKIVQQALTEAIEKAYQKQTGIKEVDNSEMKIKTEFENGNMHIYHVRKVVETDDDITDDAVQISLDEARKIQPDAQVGDYVGNEEIDFHTFDRAAIVLAKNVMKQKIREAEKEEVYEKYCDREGDMVNGYITSSEDRLVLVLLGGTPDGKQQPGSTVAVMRHCDQIPTEKYIEGSTIPVVINKVSKESKGAIVNVSRADNMFVRRLFEKEVPEIYNGIIEIKSIARDAGARAKIAVYSHNENIDPIGACIGPRGSRVQSIINELNGEKIDILEWSDDLQKYIANALAPAQDVVVIPKENGSKTKDVYAVVPDNQLSLAIGKKGQNARLAVKLTGHKIDIKSQSQMEELGIDYKVLAKAMHDQYEEEKALERAYKQQQRIDELKSTAEGSQGIEDVDFTYASDLEPEENMNGVETLASVQSDELLPAAEPELEPAVTTPESRELNEMEQAAKIAKENRVSLADRRAQYTSKFEPQPEAQPAAPAKKAAAKPEAREEKKPAFKKKPTFAAMQPIYTEDELREIEEEELEEELSASWNEDVDYEEYDEYYDDEY